MDTLHELGEDGFLELFRPIFQRHTRDLILGTGDDVAVTPPEAPNQRLVWTIDSMIEGTHFRFWPNLEDAAWLGHKLAACNLSDLASKGACPTYALLSLGVPGNASVNQLRSFYAGLDAQLSEHGAALIGGDTVRAPQWSLTLTLVGTLEDTLPVAARDRATPGQNLYVTGWPGESSAGFRLLESGENTSHPLVEAHIRPEPRVAEGQTLVRAFQDLAMIDISDGVTRDARRLVEESNVRIVLDETGFPLSPRLVEECAARGWNASELFLHGGEDYELLFATAADLETVTRALANTPVACIGHVESGTGLAIRRQNGEEMDLTPKGFEHFDS